MSFAVNIGNWANRTNGNVGKIRRAVALKLFGAIVLDTPVLTGRLRANWIFSSGEDITFLTTTEVDPTGDKTLATISSGLAAVKDGEDGPVNLTNSLPYAARIENDGYSQKAPEGMVRKNVTRFNQLLQEAKD